jgi:nitronate monooxygenase
MPSIFNRLRLPLIGSPLFIISGPELVIAQCKAGVVGSFPSLNARPQNLVRRMAPPDHRRAGRVEPRQSGNARRAIRGQPDRPQIQRPAGCGHGSCAKWQVPMVITSLGAREDVNNAVHGWGGIVMHDVIDDRFARKAVEKGADGLIPVAAGAGGHAGTLSPLALMQEIARMVHGRSLCPVRSPAAARSWPPRRWVRIFGYIGSAWIATRKPTRCRATRTPSSRRPR